jgi:hypothetical protein
MQIDPEARIRFNLDDPAVQSLMCSDYFFHSTEGSKIVYWKKVLNFLLADSPTSAVTPQSIREWWQSTIARRNLPGLEKVLHAITREESQFKTVSSVVNRFNKIQNGERPSAISRVASYTGALLKSVWTRVVYGESTTDDGGSLNFDEKIIDFKNYEKIIRDKLLPKFQAENESIVVSESGLLTEIHAAKFIPIRPQIELKTVESISIFFLILIEKFNCQYFKVDGINCIKIPPMNGDAEPVTELDKATVMGELALEKISQQEQNLSTQWTSLDCKVREHIRAGRKPLALTVLREKKLIEKQMDEITLIKLKMNENILLNSKISLNCLIFSALKLSNDAGKISNLSLESVQQVLADSDDLRDSVGEVTAALGTTTEVTDEDVLGEYERLVRGDAALPERSDKHVTVRRRAETPPTVRFSDISETNFLEEQNRVSEMMRILDDLPSVPSAIREQRSVVNER